MLSSDGLHGVVGTEEIEKILLDADSSLAQKCASLIGAAHSAGSPDNVTVVLIRIAGSGTTIN
jgi:serine/threonine protein phosphatase PrpC